MRNLILLISIVTLFGCGSMTEKRNIPKVSIKIERLEQKFMDCESPAEVLQFMRDHPDVTSTFLLPGVPPGQDSILAEGIFKMIQEPALDSLLKETLNVFEDIAGLESDFETAFANLKYYYPEFNPPKIYTMISGLNNDLFISDSLIVIGLDFYKGMDSDLTPLGYPDYISRRFEKEFLVPSIMLYMSDKYSLSNLEDKTMMADMIYYGKAFAFVKEMLPHAHDSVIIWYTEEELEAVKEHEDVVWAHFIQNELLFEQGHMVKNKYLGERPKTLEIGNECPGRVGAWLGWEIIRRYQEDNNDFLALMNEPDAQKLFRLSEYKPDPR